MDWLQVTFKSALTVQEIVNLIGLDFGSFMHVPDSGKFGYSSHYRFGHISVYYSETRDDIHLEITGQGCREFEQLSGYDWTSVFVLVLQFDTNITRLDLAIDDFTNTFTLRQVESKVKRGHVKSRFKKARAIKEYLLADGTDLGHTVYFGRPQSDIQIRFYDKKAEREQKGLDVLVSTWIRTELQLRDDRAKMACTLLSNLNDDNIGNFIKGILCNYLNFLVPNKNDSKKNRWNVCKWWLDFLDGVEKIKLTQVAPDATIERARKWLDKSVSTTFSTVLEAVEYDPDIIGEMILDGERKRSKKHENMLNTYRELNNINDVDMDKIQKNKYKLLKTIYEMKKGLTPDE